VGAVWSLFGDVGAAVSIPAALPIGVARLIFLSRQAQRQRLLSLALICLTALLLVMPNMPLPAIRAQETTPPPSGEVIVVLKPNGKELPAVAASKAGVRAKKVFSRVFPGFSATLSAAQAERLARNPNVAHIFPEERFQAAAQTLPTGVDRIGADENPSVDIDQTNDVRVYTDVAVLDSGISGSTGDLNLAGGVNCSSSGTGFDIDNYGHGTHVAGTIGALDNESGVVGVAPGARLWSVKVLNDAGGAFSSNLICGLEWVLANRATIDIVNFSVQGSGRDGPCDTSAFHLAICAVVNDARVPVIAAAGNFGTDAATTIPATYNEVITVSAMTDLDGQPGGLYPGEPCRGGEVDDAFATFSNYGPDVDIAAPGTCISSLRQDGGISLKSGTSMAAPHVTAAAAIYLDANPWASPEEVKAWLQGTGRAQASAEGFNGDPDSSHEPLLWLGGGAPVAEAPYRLVASGASPNSWASTYVRDRKTSTYWKTRISSSGPPAEAWVWVDLGAPKTIGTIRWVFGEAGIADSFVIEGSNDRATWSAITKRNGKPVGVWQERITSRTFRYIRFRFLNPNRDATLGGLAEVQLWAPGTAYPLPGATATATPTRTPTPTATLPPNGNYPMYGSSRSPNSTSPKAVWDGDLGTTWQTDGLSVPDSAYVFVTIGSVLPIETIRWVYGTPDIGDALTIEVSNDKVTWTPVHTAGNAPVGEWQVATFSGLSPKYVRWRFDNPNDDPVVGGLAEVEIYGPGAFAGEAPAATATASPTATETTALASPKPTATGTPLPTETDLASPAAVPATETTVTEPTATTEATATEMATAVESGPTPYAVAQTSRSASTMPGTLAVDGNPETVWQTVPGGDPGRVAVLTIDLGEPVQIGEVRILPGGEGLKGRATVETSADGVEWTFYAEPGLVSHDADGWMTVGPGDGVADPNQARFVRVVFVGSGAEPLGSIAEIEILPPPAS
jgi:subtilisin